MSTTQLLSANNGGIKILQKFYSETASCLALVQFPRVTVILCTFWLLLL